VISYWLSVIGYLLLIICVLFLGDSNSCFANNSNYMTGQFASFIDNCKSKIMLLFSILVFIFWCVSISINIYHFVFVGVIFEILWMPMIVFIVILPIIALLFWRNEKFNVRSINLYSTLIGYRVQGTQLGVEFRVLSAKFRVPTAYCQV
jgi:hypothetical protein